LWRHSPLGGGRWTQCVR